MPTFDTVIKGGTVIDGLKSGRFAGDIGIKEGRIAEIGRINASEGARVLDASGLIVAPGFIDLHTHYDSQLFWDPYCSISSWHGVTSVAIGNCGFGFAPCRPEDRDRAMLTMSRNEAVPLATMQAGMPWDWVSYPEFLNSVERTPKGVNVLSYQPLAPLMAYVMGAEAGKGRAATDAERAEMCRLLEESMAAGGCGWSAQLFGQDSIQRDYDGTPMITDTMSERDLLAFAGVLGKVRRGFMQAIGSSHELYEQLSEQSGGRPIIYNVVALSTDQHGVAQENFRKTLQWIADANQRGHRIYAQAVTTEIAFEFTLATWNLFDTSPVWRVVTLGTTEERIAKMSDPSFRKALKEEYDSAGTNPRANFTGVTGGRGIPGLEVHFVNDDALKSKYEGFTLAEIAEREGKHVIDAFLDLAVADKLDTTFGTPPQAYDLGQMKELISNPYAIPGISDGGAHTKFMTFGAYPTEYLSNVRDHDLISLEDAHWALSALPAMAAGFRDRGWIREGMPADLVVYDLASLKMGPQHKAWDYPANEWRQVRKAEGYRWIMVNGDVTFENGECTGATPGSLLRHGYASQVPVPAS